jgi:hypothetical protein
MIGMFDGAHFVSKDDGDVAWSSVSVLRICFSLAESSVLVASSRINRSGLHVQGPGQSDTLALSAGEPDLTLPDQGVELMLQPAHKISGACYFQRFP